METPIPVANGMRIAKNPSTIITIAHPMDIPAASLRMPVVLCSLMLFSPLLVLREMRGTFILTFLRALNSRNPRANGRTASVDLGLHPVYPLVKYFFHLGYALFMFGPDGLFRPGCSCLQRFNLG